MKDFSGRVAVITGAASGMGRALADRCAREGMKVVLADVEQAPLRQAEAEIRASGAVVLSVIDRCFPISGCRSAGTEDA